MKYSYLIQELQMNGYKKIYFSLEEGLEPVSNFLNIDVGGEVIGLYFINRLKKVLNGDVPMDSTGGNTSSLTIKPDFTDVEEKYLKKRTVQLETSELIPLIEAFITEKKKFEESSGKK